MRVMAGDGRAAVIVSAPHNALRGRQPLRAACLDGVAAGANAREEERLGHGGGAAPRRRHTSGATTKAEEKAVLTILLTELLTDR